MSMLSTQQRPAMFSWQQPLAALFGGLSAAGQPGGLANFGAGVNQTMQAQAQQAQQQQIAELRRMQIEQAQAEMNRANKEQADREAAAQQVAAMFGGGQSQVRPVGNYGAAVGGAPQPSMFGNLSPEQSALLQQRAKIDPMGTLDFVTQQAFAQPEGASSGIGKIMEDLRNGLIDQATADALIKKETYIAPAAQGPDTWERYIDPQTGRSGQINKRTGKIDWDPGNTMMTVVGTDPNGNPIYDFVSGSPGPTKEHEVKAANQSLLLGQGLSELERLYNNENVSSWRMAGSETLAENLGPIGSVLGQKVLTEEDKQFISGRARALESLANTITGAAFTEEQKKNFIAMLPQPTDDLQTASIKIRQAKEYVAELERNAKVSDRRGSSGQSKAPSEMTDDELMQELSR
jgi:hypothetical protein